MGVAPGSWRSGCLQSAQLQVGARCQGRMLQMRACSEHLAARPCSWQWSVRASWFLATTDSRFWVINALQKPQPPPQFMSEIV